MRSSTLLPNVTPALWRAWTLLRLAAIAAVVAVDVWLRAADHGHRDVRLDALAVCLIVLVFAGPWRYDPYAPSVLRGGWAGAARRR